ncbi:hypothetical protein PanWU01x14_194140, partial [Parasponia andersonii]
RKNVSTDYDSARMEETQQNWALQCQTRAAPPKVLENWCYGARKLCCGASSVALQCHSMVP